MPIVNPKILIWARETAGLTLEEAAHGIELKDAYGQTGAERLAAIESGKDEPTRRLLLNMARRYRRPLLVFYLDEIPKRGDRGQDFRTVPGAQAPAFDANLDALIRNIKSRQSLVRALLEDEDMEPLPFVGSASVRNNVPELAQRIVATLSFDLAIFREQQKKEDAFAYLRSCIEGVGIFVVLAGNLGSHHSDISADAFRGFAIADPIAPFIVINEKDAHAAWSFTALHETTHIWLGTTGISGASIGLEIERLCNDVASEILLPGGEIQELVPIADLSIEEAMTQISNFADERNVSRAMIAYRLLRSNIINDLRWRELNYELQQDYQEIHRVDPNKEKKKKGGPSYYVVRRHRLGRALLGLVDRSLAEGNLTYSKAGYVLDVKPRNIETLLHDTP